MAANPRRLRGGALNAACDERCNKLTAKVLMQQTEQEMILPCAVDAEIAPRQPLAGKAAFLENPDGRLIAGNASRLDAMQIEFAEQRRQQHPQRRRHVAAAGVGLA